MGGNSQVSYSVCSQSLSKAMKHPENVEALILASPVGMGEKSPSDESPSFDGEIHNYSMLLLWLSQEDSVLLMIK